MKGKLFVYVLTLCTTSLLLTVHASPNNTWTCATVKAATVHKSQVEHGFLPSAVIENEVQAVHVQERLNHYKVPAISVAVIHDGNLDWTAAWGNLQADGPAANCDSVFQAGSIAKPVTVLAAFRMKEKALLDFDKNIESYLTSYHLPSGQQSEQNPVTLRNLFTHTSGITAGGYMGYAQGLPLPSDVQTLKAEPPSNARKVEVLSAPNAELRYSGGAYTVAEVALQDKFKEPIDALMRKWIIDPVGMRQASFLAPLPSTQHARIARGHSSDGTMIKGGWHTHPEQAAAGLWATASDLATFLIELRKAYRGESAVISKESVRELLANPIDNHAYGFRLITADNQVFIVHYGGTVGYNAGMLINLETGSGAAYLINSDNGAMLGEEYLAAVSRAYNWPLFREERVKRAPIEATLLRTFVGPYVFEQQGWKVDLVYENEALVIVFPNGDRYSMIPIEGEPFSFIHADTAVRAQLIPAAESAQLKLYGQIGKQQKSAP